MNVVQLSMDMGYTYKFKTEANREEVKRSLKELHRKSGGKDHDIVSYLISKGFQSEEFPKPDIFIDLEHVTWEWEFNHDQFLIAFDMSNAVFHSFRSENGLLFVEVSGLNILCNSEDGRPFRDYITYDKWLEEKYSNSDNNGESYKWVEIKDRLTLLMKEPIILYKGTQKLFLDAFHSFDFTSNKKPKGQYVLGGVYIDSDFDEFTVYSDY